MSRILREFRNWRDPMPGTRWQRWSDALEQNPHVQATTSQDELYVETIDVYLRISPSVGDQQLAWEGEKVFVVVISKLVSSIRAHDEG